MSASSHSAESPINSTVTSCAEQGMFSPSVVLNTRQSGRKSIMGLFQFFDFLHEIGGFIEPPVDAGVADIGYRIERSQAFHYARADRAVGNFAIEVVAEIFDDFFDQAVDGLLSDGPFLACLQNAGRELYA